jgi:long-chain fatty acid transport protein
LLEVGRFKTWGIFTIMKKIIVVLLIGMSVATSLHAGGYRVATQGQRALAMGHTGVAMTDSAESIFFNPGGNAS